MQQSLQTARLAYAGCIDYVVANAKSAPSAVYGQAVNYLLLAGLVLTGWQQARSLLAALDLQAQDPDFSRAKVLTARFHAQTLLTRVEGLARTVQDAGATVDLMRTPLFH